MRDYLPHIKVFFTEFENITETESFKEIVKKRDYISSLLYRIIKDGIDAGQFRDDIHPGLVSMLLVGMLNWFYQWYRPDGELSAEEITEDAEKIIFEGVLKRISQTMPMTKNSWLRRHFKTLNSYRLIPRTLTWLKSPCYGAIRRQAPRLCCSR